MVLSQLANSWDLTDNLFTMNLKKNFRLYNKLKQFFSRYHSAGSFCRLMPYYPRLCYFLFFVNVFLPSPLLYSLRFGHYETLVTVCVKKRRKKKIGSLGTQLLVCSLSSRTRHLSPVELSEHFLRYSFFHIRHTSFSSGSDPQRIAEARVSSRQNARMTDRGLLAILLIWLAVHIGKQCNTKINVIPMNTHKSNFAFNFFFFKI